MHLFMIKNGEEIDTSLIFGFDEDFNGNNGSKFTSEEALKAGFESDLDYYTNIAESLYPGDNKKILEIVGEAFEARNKNYYDIEIETLETDCGLVIGLCLLEL